MSDMGGAEDHKKTFKYRAALTAVIILSILIVLALIALVVGAVMKFGNKPDEAAAIPAQVQSQPFNLPPGVRIISSETQGERLILRVKNGEDEEIYIVDTVTGQLVSRLKAAGSE